MTVFLKLYRHAVLRTPVLTLAVMVVLALVCLSQARHFFLDASTDALILESDPQLRLFREISLRYKTRPLLAVTYTPDKGDVFDPANLDRIQALRDEIRLVAGVESAISILDAPLFQNPPVPVSQVTENVKTLEDPDVDPELARQEIMSSEAYRQQLISEDGRTAVIAINLVSNEALESLRERRARLQIAVDQGQDVRRNRKAYHELTPRLRKLQRAENREIRKLIERLRQILAEHGEHASIHLGGGPMIADDMLSYIKSDLKVFGVAMFLCIAAILKLFFGSKRWVLTAVACCAYSTLVMVGLLGACQWPVTVISSNFISLLLIMNMSLVIHLIVQYREIARGAPGLPAEETISRTVAHKWTPCLFTTLTTIAGFSSLILCDIKPVKDFGLMMSLALVVSMGTSFILFPSLLMLFAKEDDSTTREVGRPVTRLAAAITERAGPLIGLATVAVIAFIAFGVGRLTVENSFVNHFRKSSEIRKGMVFIDQQLGGTTPVDVVLDLPAGEEPDATPVSVEEDDDFGEFSEFGTAADSDTYWYTPAKLEVVRQAHRVIEDQPETGKVWSLATLLRVTDRLNDGVQLDAFELAIMAKKLPDYARDILVEPFVSIDDNQLRLTARIYDSREDIRRAQFLDRLERDLHETVNLPDDAIHINGALVLYTGVLQSLFRSQILTLGVVFVVLFLMFLALFRSAKLSLIALFPNLVSALTVLGVLGALRIPLDIMTITIASISIGIAVDDTIHYIHRFREEFRARGNYLEAMRASHRGVGSAMYYTSVTIVIGFSLLVFSNFVPSILFGVLTGVAMIVALVGALTLLPWLLTILRPFGRERTMTGRCPTH